jgi:hypothetical protein
MRCGFMRKAALPRADRPDLVAPEPGDRVAVATNLQQ